MIKYKALELRPHGFKYVLFNLLAIGHLCAEAFFCKIQTKIESTSVG